MWLPWSAGRPGIFATWAACPTRWSATGATAASAGSAGTRPSTWWPDASELRRQTVWRSISPRGASRTKSIMSRPRSPDSWGRTTVGRPREAIGLLQGGDARLRRDVRKVEDRGLRLEHGHHAARLRRRQREGDHEPGLGPGHGGAGEVRPHAGSRPQRSPGWRRGGGGAEPVRRRTTGRGQGRRPNRPDVGLPTAYGEGPFRGRNGRRGP